MANWCSNLLYVNASETSAEDFAKFEHFIHDLHPNEGFFEHFIPQPTNLARKVKAFEKFKEKKGGSHIFKLIQEKKIRDYNDLDRNWHIQNWGITHDLTQDDFDIGKSNEWIQMMFKTKWGPPLAGLRKISTHFPKIEFDVRFADEMMEFCGQSIFKNGKEIVQKSYSPCTDDLLSELDL